MKLERETFRQRDVQEFLQKRAIAIHVDPGQNRALAKSFGVQYLPTVVFVNADGRELDKFVGPKGPAEFMRQAGGLFR